MNFMYALTLLAGLLLAIFERIPRLRFRAQPLLRPFLATDLLHLGVSHLALGALGFAGFAAASSALGALGAPRLSALPLPFWLSVGLCLVLIDLGNYLAHVALHRFEPLWELHKVHHSSARLDWVATFRSHVLEQTFRRAVAPLALIALGAPLDALLVAAGLFNVWAMSNHANLALRSSWLEPLFVTPRLHRLHHAPETTDRNYGTLFSVWDRLRGTLVVRDFGPHERLGVPAEPDYPQTWGAQLGEPLRRWRGRAAPPLAAGTGGV